MDRLQNSSLRELRKRFGYSLTYVAEHLDVSVQSVKVWQRGTSRPNSEHIPVIAHLFNITITGSDRSLQNALQRLPRWSDRG
jgi:DNA-binding transcriptional regulator YiaG